jgi:hypothetical protein
VSAGVEGTGSTVPTSRRRGTKDTEASDTGGAMTTKHPKTTTPKKDDPHLRAKAAMEQQMKKTLHRPAARIGEMKHNKGQ